MKLKDKVAVVFGGTSGIGEATAKAYAEEGAKVVVTGRDEEDGNRIVNEITEKNMEAIFVRADATDATEVKQVIDKGIETYDHIDILYNGAGIHDKYKTAVEVEEDEYDKLMAVNVKAPYLASRAVIPHFLERGSGTIINVGSQATHVAGPGGSAYITSKHAIEGFTKQLAYDFGEKGIKANLIAPGFIDTPMTEGIEDERLKDIPAQRAGKPEEVAALAVFLASDDSSYMHGSTVTMDGGWVTGR
ncbi:3-oxoacyl-[acyl-carrier protein] reductase [Alkalibacterium putridalgicola]|uniref:3-oxoacyl-[acyl-carrier protein] reductase n=1 Tax=Alkalibacterium putridalgicola TaxID=426703 RepID=A0A1H7TFR2_9LACT|nr:glucose 1-dehydrogenase [Alkalibacterium putridalgicola]GEK89457.1 NAD(P)-dependent dehydrogenase [Alkalibacterium putridalgicola]SEL83661.1 3-oxoacyl-[acyl-carrier protein] reductase [Alkalibacterium putridalgicola]